MFNKQAMIHITTESWHGLRDLVEGLALSIRGNKVNYVWATGSDWNGRYKVGGEKGKEGKTRRDNYNQGKYKVFYGNLTQ